eukprot:5210-Heterococcus_DN1.PRE.1
MAVWLLCAWFLCCCTSLLVNGQIGSDALANVVNTRRLVAAVPVIVPSGAYYRPVGVTLTAGPGDVVFYTVDGSLPNRTSAFVQSGQYVVINANSTLKAMAAPSATVPGGESAVATKTYTVHMQAIAGRAPESSYLEITYVAAVLVMGHSGIVVRADLDTSHYKSYNFLLCHNHKKVLATPVNVQRLSLRC